MLIDWTETEGLVSTCQQICFYLLINCSAKYRNHTFKTKEKYVVTFGQVHWLDIDGKVSVIK